VSAPNSNLTGLMAEYVAGPAVLQAALAGLTESQLRTAAAPGTWSPLELVAHIADAEILYADRLIRVLGMERPALPSLDPDAVLSRLPGNLRDLQEELALITAVRKRMARILGGVTAADFQREGIHSEAGPLTAEALFTRVVRHLPHHAEILRQKRPNLGATP
jgi:hypothetical protein